MDVAFDTLAVPPTSVLQSRLKPGSAQPLDNATLAKVADAIARGDPETRALAEFLVWTLIEQSLVTELDGYLADFVGDLSQAVKSFEAAGGFA